MIKKNNPSIGPHYAPPPIKVKDSNQTNPPANLTHGAVPNKKAFPNADKKTL